MNRSATRVQGAATRVQLPTIEENEIGTVIRKRYNNGIHNGEVTHYYTDVNLYFISYENGENEKINQHQLNRYRCTDRDRDMTRRITRLQARLHQANVVKEMNKSSARTGAKLPAHFTNAVFDEDTGQMLDYKKLINHNKKETREWWQRSSANEFGKLMKGAGRNKDGTQRAKGSDTLHFIHKKDISKGKKITYAWFCCDIIRLQKEEINRTRMTIGGNLLEYEGKTSTEKASLETIKIHLNSTISTKNAKYAAADIGNFYTNSKLDTSESMRIHLSLIPQEIIEEYQAMKFVDIDGYVYCEITGVMYGLAQSGQITNQNLQKHLAKYGYYPTRSRRTPGLWKHKTRKINFTLIVDDFGIKYTNKDDIDHLFAAIKDKYPLKIDWEGAKYLGIDLDWNFTKQEVILSMKGYVEQALKQFKHLQPTKHHYGPTKYKPPEYGQKIQYTTVDTSPELTQTQKQLIQQVCGKFLYNGRGVDATQLHPLNELSIKATEATEETQTALIQFLNYIASNPDGTIIYRANDMILSCESDAAYLVAPKSRSRAGGYHYLGNKAGTQFNGPIYVLAKIIKAVMGSAAEAEVGGLYMNALELSPMRTTLEELDHPQPPTPLKTDNSTADGIMNKTIKQRQSKAMDKRFYWLQDRVEQGKFRVFWAPGK